MQKIKIIKKVQCPNKTCPKISLSSFGIGHLPVGAEPPLV